MTALIHCHAMAWQTEDGEDKALIPRKIQQTVDAVQCEHGSTHDSPLRPSTMRDDALIEALIPRKTQWQWMQSNMSMAANMTHLYDGSMLWQKHIQGHCSAMDQNVDVRMRQKLCLLLQCFTCKYAFVTISSTFHCAEPSISFQSGIPRISNNDSSP